MLTPNHVRDAAKNTSRFFCTLCPHVFFRNQHSHKESISLLGKIRICLSKSLTNLPLRTPACLKYLKRLGGRKNVQICPWKAKVLGEYVPLVILWRFILGFVGLELKKFALC